VIDWKTRARQTQQSRADRLSSPAPLLNGGTGEGLVVVGAALRRSAALGAKPERSDAVLRSISAEQVRAWLAGLRVERLHERLLRATLESVEAGLADPDEADTWQAWAVEAIAERDDLESALAAVARWLSLNGELPALARDRDRVATELQALDGRMSPRTRWLVALNEARRAERDLLDPDHREGAWWFSARADCEALLPALAGGPGDPHLSTCAECAADLRATQDIHSPRLRHLSEEDFWRIDTGSASGEERAVVEAHGARCPECAEALQALEVGDAFIAEALGEPPPPVQPRRPVPAEPQRARRREVLAEQSGVRVELVRENRKARLIARAPAMVLTRVELLLSDASYEASAGSEGFEIDLPEEVSGPATLRIFCHGKRAPLVLRVSL
jgi:hypothetical protein